MSFFVLLVLISAAFSNDFNGDFSRLYNPSLCDPCFFNQSEINSQTIELWPANCSSMCTVLTFTSNSNNVPFEKLKATFKSLTKIKGAVRMDSTVLTNFSFLDSLKYISNEDFLENSVTNNPNLVDAKWLYTVKYSYTDSPIKVMNNTKLDVSSLCTSRNYNDFVRLYVSQNKKDCGCIGTVFTVNNVNNYKNCTSMFGIIEITNVSDASSFTAFANLQNITGNITIHNTGFQNLSFFTNLKSIVGDEPEGVATLNVMDNPNMTRFALDSLEKLYHVKEWFYMSIQNVHPDFCLTMEEMQFFTHINTKFTNLQAVYCNTTIRKDNQKTCIFGSMSTLDNNCVHVIGRVLVGPGDESYVEKFSTVQYIYGSLTIQNTTLSSLSFLANLTNVALLNDTGPAIQFLSNPNLSDIYLESMAFPFSIGPNRFVIRNNAHDIFEDSYACQNYQNQVRAAVLYNGGDCSMLLLPNNDDEEEAVDKSSGESEKSTNRPGTSVAMSFLVLVFSYFWFQ